jgi:hypothetical protein
MQEIGLVPSDTGQPGGARTGQRMTHYIEANGKFARALNKMPKEYALPWLTGEVEALVEKPKPPKKVKLTCPVCMVSVWIEEENVGHEVGCGECGDNFLTKDELKERKEEEREDD